MYIPVFWQDRIVEHPRRVRVTDLGNGIKEWAPDPGEISQKGTQQSSTNFGNMDFGNVENALLGAYLAMNVRLAHNYIDDLRGQIITSTLKNINPDLFRVEIHSMARITPIHTKPAKQPQQKATVPAAQEQPEQRPDQARRHGSMTEHARESRTGLEIAGNGVLVCVLRTAKFRSSPATLPRNRYHTPTRPHSGRLSSRTDHLLNLEQPEL